MIKFLKLNKLNLLLILIAIFYFLNKTNFKQNLHSIIKINQNERINNLYGYCGGESIGYLRYLKSKYNFNFNPQIINFDRTAPNLWAIYNTNKSLTNLDYTIILNYPGEEIDVNLFKIKDNFFEIYDMDFLGPISADEFKISIKEKEINKIKLEFFTKYSSNDLYKIKNLDIKKSSGENFFKVNFDFKELKISEKKLFLKISSKKLKNNTDVTLKLTNKYQIDKLEILDQFKNCYLTKTYD